MNQPLFNAQTYSQFRPSYPAGLFEDVLEVLKDKALLRVLDLGCGTGLSIEAFLQDASRFDRNLNENLEITGIDIDPFMAKEALKTKCRILNQDATQTTFENKSFDLIFSGSAYHWFHGANAFKEVDRLLDPSGVFLGFEYQFPRAIQNLSLNQFIKSQFNLYWKAPAQVPRGNFLSLFQSFLDSPSFSRKTMKRLEMKKRLSVSDFVGHLISQSRYIHFESSMSPEEKERYRRDLYSKIDHLFEGHEALDFDFYFDRVMFVRSCK